MCHCKRFDASRKRDLRICISFHFIWLLFRSVCFGLVWFSSVRFHSIHSYWCWSFFYLGLNGIALTSICLGGFIFVYAPPLRGQRVINSFVKYIWLLWPSLLSLSLNRQHTLFDRCLFNILNEFLLKLTWTFAPDMLDFGKKTVDKYESLLNPIRKIHWNLHCAILFNHRLIK